MVMGTSINRELLDRVYEAVLEDSERGAEFREILQTGSMTEKLDAFYDRDFTEDQVKELAGEIDKLFAKSQRGWWVY
jgi:hypothetical protein